MSWTPLDPPARTRAKASVSASVFLRRDGCARLRLVVGQGLHEEFGKPVAARLLAGGGDHAGQLRVEFAAEGPFKFSRYANGGGCFLAPGFNGVPAKAAANAACEVVERDLAKGVLVVALPMAAWGAPSTRKTDGPTDLPAPKAAAPAPAPKAALKAAAQPTPAPAPAAETAKPLDPVEYLSAKGHQVWRLAGGRFGLDGETVMPPVILEAVNKHRAKAELPPLTLKDIR